MARLCQVLLDVDRVVAEGGHRLRPRGGERMREVFLRARDLHAAPAAPGRGLDQHRIADLGGDLPGLGFVGDAALGARHAGDAEALCRALRLDLVAHGPDVLGLGADEGDVVRGQDLGKARVLGQEAVAGMDRVGAGDLAGRNQGRDVEIAVAGGRRPDAHALVGEPHMHGVGVGGRVDGDGRDAELLRGAQDAQRDLAPVRDEDLVEHLIGAPADHSITRSGSPYSTGVPSSTKIAVTTPARGAVMSLKVFIASISRSLSPASTREPISMKFFASGEALR